MDISSGNPSRTRVPLNGMVSGHITEQRFGYSEDTVSQLFSCFLWLLPSLAADECTLHAANPQAVIPRLVVASE